MNSTHNSLPPDFFMQKAERVARDLLGCVLSVIEDDGAILSGTIVETEAYPPGDPASHAFRGPSGRNRSMFLPGGRCYVYRIYGIHRCLNVVTGPSGIGAAVLIRALEPLEGLQVMHERRFGHPNTAGSVENGLRNLCSGPGKLCQALGISVERHDGAVFNGNPAPGTLHLRAGMTVPESEVGHSQRIGLSPGRGDREILRMYISGSQFCSRRGRTRLRN